MKRLPHVAILLLAACLVAADKGEKKKGDAEKIQGKWTLIEFHHKGKKSGNDVGNVYTFSGEGLANEKGVYADIYLRPDKKPRELDLVLKGGVGLKFGAIYELSGDKLKICFADFGRMRPKKMESTKDGEEVLWVLKRAKGDAKK